MGTHLGGDFMSRLNRRISAALAIALAPAAAFATDEPLTGVSGHVVIISIDGLRPDAIDEFDAHTLERLMREGAYSLKAQTILPSKTLPSHTSMLTGVDADGHGITWNSDQTDEHGHVDVPTIFALARDAGYRTAAFFSKTKFHHLEVPQSLDYVRSPEGGLLTGRFTWRKTVGLVEEYLESSAEAPNLMFVHIGEPDYAGHVFGWMSGIYGLAVKQADNAVAEIIDEANDRFGAGNYTLIVTADHGGHGRDHGSADPRDTTIPWIIWGKGVQSGAAIPATIRTMDTAATALWILGVEAPTAWVGKPVTAAFSSTPLVAAK
jgi:predicted AlkP superfamily pyrophosphatase or phosphodiesterase